MLARWNQAAISDRAARHTRCNGLQRLATSIVAGERALDLLSVNGAEGARWRPFEPDRPPLGYASFYYADDLAALPVRAVTRIKDNKSDPNIETGTYGLFSTCQERMRAGIVKHGASHLFFFARPRGAERHLTGMYELAAWTPGALGADAGDFALAAGGVRFIAPIPLSQLPSELATALGTRWRLSKRLSVAQTHELAALIAAKPDMTSDYLLEVDRLERLNKFHSGYRYPTWQREDPWTWADAAAYMRPADAAAGGARVSNASPTGWWGCEACDAAIENGALLKACPSCRKLGTLRPLNAPAVARIVRSS
jgi:hypothetical protein